jgi:large subunit ribosomal protein L15
MTARRRSKNSRHRGSNTHSWGSKKKHGRGGGRKGGRGNSGTGKRADTKLPSVWKIPDYFGKHGFKKLSLSEKISPVNLSYFEENAEKLIAEKLAEKKGDVYYIDAEKLGFNKVLGDGKLAKKLKITCKYFSKNAIEKVKAAGGEAIGTGKKESKETKEMKAKAPANAATAAPQPDKIPVNKQKRAEKPAQ